MSYEFGAAVLTTYFTLPKTHNVEIDWEYYKLFRFYELG